MDLKEREGSCCLDLIKINLMWKPQDKLNFDVWRELYVCLLLIKMLKMFTKERSWISSWHACHLSCLCHESTRDTNVMTHAEGSFVTNWIVTNQFQVSAIVFFYTYQVVSYYLTDFNLTERHPQSVTPTSIFLLWYEKLTTSKYINQV